MRNSFISIARLIDRNYAKCYLNLVNEKKSLISFYFHGIYRDHKEIDLNIADPEANRGMTIEHFKQLVEHFLKNNFIFISPDDILNGLENNKNNILITFDDGYFNNKSVLPILKEYMIPAVFFISANHVKYQKCFWWDVIYRERRKSGVSLKRISHEIEQLKSKRYDEIEKYVIDEFGAKALKPISDIDRPFTSEELREIAKNKYVFIGNHTSDHAILTNYSSDEIRTQIIDAQNTIYDITKIRPNVISYPNGNYSDEVMSISKKLGLKLGFTIEAKKNYLPINAKNLMCLGRFALNGSKDIIDQCRVARSDFRLLSILKSMERKGAKQKYE